MALTAYLLLDVAGTPCALARDEVREILPLPRLHAPPTAAGPLAGLLDLGGEPVPVIDLAVLFGLTSEPHVEENPYRHVVLARRGDLGLLVDRALDLVRVAEDVARPVQPERSLNGCVAGAFEHGGRLVHRLTLDRILTSEERARLDALAGQARARRARFGFDEARAV